MVKGAGRIGLNSPLSVPLKARINPYDRQERKPTVIAAGYRFLKPVSV